VKRKSSSRCQLSEKEQETDATSTHSQRNSVSIIEQIPTLPLHQPRPHAALRLWDWDVWQGFDDIYARSEPHAVVSVVNTGLNHDGAPGCCEREEAQLGIHQGLKDAEDEDDRRRRLLGVEDASAGQAEGCEAHWWWCSTRVRR
jgi:hypothetical protein